MGYFLLGSHPRHTLTVCDINDLCLFRCIGKLGSAQTIRTRSLGNKIMLYKYAALILSAYRRGDLNMMPGFLD